jgi:hypothetical protein
MRQRPRRSRPSRRSAHLGAPLHRAAGQSPPAARRRARSRSKPRARAFLGAPRTLTFGARFEASRRFAASWDAGLDLEAALGKRRVALGDAEARLMSIGGWLGVRGGGAVWSATTGLGARLGLAELRGAADETGAQGHEVTRVWGGPALVLRGDGAIAPVAFAILLEGGLAVAGAEGLADRTHAIALSRGWLAASLNVGLRL